MAGVLAQARLVLSLVLLASSYCGRAFAQNDASLQTDTLTLDDRAQADAGPASASVEGSAMTPPASAIGFYVSTEWRAMNLAQSFGHGPGLAGGVTLGGGWLRLGIVSFARPGPINPATFSVPTADGASYRGSSQLSLRSDGAFIGAQIVLAFDMPGAPWLRVSVPLNVGQAAFGFYLSGEDRNTPDGRLVSEWEDELMAGRDSSVGLGLESGLQLGWKVVETPWVQPYVSATYFSALGYDSYVSDSYAGMTGSAGVTFGYGL